MNTSEFTAKRGRKRFNSAIDWLNSPMRAWSVLKLWTGTKFLNPESNLIFKSNFTNPKIRNEIQFFSKIVRNLILGCRSEIIISVTPIDVYLFYKDFFYLSIQSDKTPNYNGGRKNEHLKVQQHFYRVEKLNQTYSAMRQRASNQIMHIIWNLSTSINVQKERSDSSNCVKIYMFFFCLGCVLFVCVI